MLSETAPCSCTKVGAGCSYEDAQVLAGYEGHVPRAKRIQRSGAEGNGRLVGAERIVLVRRDV